MPIESLNKANQKSPIPLSQDSPPPPTGQELTEQIHQILRNGLKNNHSQEYVADQLFKLGQQQLEFAKEHSLTDYQTLKAGVAQVYKFAEGNRPLALVKDSEYDLFQWGVRISQRRNVGVRPMTPEEKEVIRKVGRDVAALAEFSATVAAAPALVTVVKATWRWLVRAAATPQGQEGVKNTVECVDALVDESPPPIPTTTTHAKCYIATRTKDFLKKTFSE